MPDTATRASAINAALLTAQSTMEAVAKTGRNESQGWNFMTVEDVTRAARQALTDAGLAAVYSLVPTEVPDPHWLHGELTVFHPESGDTLRFPMPWPVERAGPQGRRQAFSYARKQALIELLMIAEPDDPETTANPRDARPASDPVATTSQRGYMRGLSERLGWSVERLTAWVEEENGIEARAMTAPQASNLITALEIMVREHEADDDTEAAE